MPPRRPNILLIVTDQQRADHVGFGGNDIVRTPHLDALAARGTVFDRALVANPICMPNRSSILTGRVPSAHGCIFNDRSLSWNVNTFPRELRKAGYETALIGKSHLQHGLSRNVHRDATAAPASFLTEPVGWDTWENAERYLDGPVDVPTPFYGFDHVELTIGHGDQVTGHHYRWALAKGADPKLLTQDWGPESPAKRRSDEWWQVFEPQIPEELYSTTFVTERTISWLEATSRDEPWMLQCSFPDPHHPFTPPGRWFDAYRPEDMPVSASFDDPLTDAPKHLRTFRKLKPSKNVVQMFGPTRAQLQHATAAEYGMIEMIDAGVGRVLEAVERLGMADDTIIVFTSDHGDMFGDHGLMLKGTMHYEGCIRVPLVIAQPGRTGTRSSALASSLDLAQTLLELADVPVFDGMQGTSLVPVLDDPSASVRDHVYIEEDFPAAEIFPIFPYKVRTVVTDEGRITRYDTGEVEVYDWAGDPEERVNLAVGDRDPKRVASLSDALTGALIDYSDTARPEPEPESDR
jgi:arylsulfatase A-like enzyme